MTRENRPSPVRRLRVQVVEERPHSMEAFTQGLVLFEDALFESVGEYGRSALREVDPRSGKERRRSALPRDVFGEGLAKVGDTLVQLSWYEEKALVWDVRTLELKDHRTYSGEGWGLCYDGRRLVMSDGSSRLTFRDPDSFQPLHSIEVLFEGEPVGRLNELEFAQGRIYANVWPTHFILEIDPVTGACTACIDASELKRRVPRLLRLRMDVLNGIAHDPETGRFLLTGKRWPILFEVEFSE